MRASELVNARARARVLKTSQIASAVEITRDSFRLPGQWKSINVSRVNSHPISLKIGNYLRAVNTFNTPPPPPPDSSAMHRLRRRDAISPRTALHNLGARSLSTVRFTRDH